MIPENIKHFWSFINTLKKETGIPTLMQHNGSMLDNSQDIANAFAAHFQSSYRDHTIINIEQHDHLAVECGSPLLHHRFTAAEVVDRLRQLDCSKGAGSDGIPPIFLSVVVNFSLTRSVLSFKRPLTKVSSHLFGKTQPFFLYTSLGIRQMSPITKEYLCSRPCPRLWNPS